MTNGWVIWRGKKDGTGKKTLTKTRKLKRVLNFTSCKRSCKSRHAADYSLFGNARRRSCRAQDWRCLVSRKRRKARSAFAARADKRQTPSRRIYPRYGNWRRALAIIDRTDVSKPLFFHTKARSLHRSIHCASIFTGSQAGGIAGEQPQRTTGHLLQRWQTKGVRFAADGAGRTSQYFNDRRIST